MTRLRTVALSSPAPPNKEQPSQGSRHFRRRVRSGKSGACAARSLPGWSLWCSRSSSRSPPPPARRGPVPSCYPGRGAVRVLCYQDSRGALSRRMAVAMAMDQMNALCEELVKAVTVMMDPSSTQRYRLEALKVAGVWRLGPARTLSPSPVFPAPPTRPLDLLSQPRGIFPRRPPRLFPLPAFSARRVCPFPGRFGP